MFLHVERVVHRWVPRPPPVPQVKSLLLLGALLRHVPRLFATIEAHAELLHFFLHGGGECARELLLQFLLGQLGRLGFGGSALIASIFMGTGFGDDLGVKFEGLLL